jgi:hypothetical protein
MLTLTELCNELNNWFDKDRIFGVFKIADGELTGMSDYLQEGQYFRIVGSIFNDGVHKHPVTGLVDEVFDGAVWLMAVPPSVVDLSVKINEWENKYGGVDSVAMSPFQSESFGGYSYTKKSGGGSDNSADTAGSWQGAFASELNKWRKIRP